MAGKKTVKKLQGDNMAPAPSGGEAGREVGVTGVKQYSGYIFDEFQKELKGDKGRKKLREMADSDPIIGAMIFAIESLLKAVEWNFEASPEDANGEKADWMKETIYNIDSMSWDDVIGELASMIVFGFALLEIVTIRKEDGTIGLKKLAPRSQDTILRWEFDASGDVIGAWQSSEMLAARPEIFIPLWKCLHVTTKYNRGNPEGRSMLRNAYKPYHFIDVLSISEAIGAERSLAGLPVLYAPSDKLANNTDKAALEVLVRDVRANEQGGLIIPSDPFVDGDGKLSGVRQFEMKLLSADASGKVDTDKIILRHQGNMARSLLADFLMLGATSSGSFALSSNKTELFVRAVEALARNIAQSIDRQLTPILWMVNGWPAETMPKAKPGRVAPVDLKELGDFIAKVTGSGFNLMDEETENYVREAGGLPPAPEGRAAQEALIPDNPNDQNIDPNQGANE